MRILSSVCLAYIAAVITSCGSSASAPAEYPPMDPPVPETGSENAERPPAQTASEPPRREVTVHALDHAPIEGEPPTLRIRQPRDGQLVKRGPVTIRLALENWALAPAPGNHVHVIVDDEAYIAVRDVSRPIDLSALFQTEFERELAPGSHVLRTFPSRAHHESVKNDAAFGVVFFHLGERTEGFAFDENAPLLTYSRPKGCNPVSDPVLLDFFVSHATLGAGAHKVRYTIDGETTGLITEWKPHSIEGLGAGDHTIRLELVTAAGALVPGMFNDTSRTFRVAETCN